MLSSVQPLLMAALSLFFLSLVTLFNYQVSRDGNLPLGGTIVPQQEAGPALGSRSRTTAAAGEDPHLFVGGAGLLSCGDLSERNPVTLREAESFVHSARVTSSEPQFAAICLGTHGHHHSIRFEVHVKDTSRTCQLFLSTTHSSPDRTHWDWRADSHLDRSLVIFTFSEEFRRQSYRAVFLGIYGDSETCNVSIKVDKYDNFNLLSRTGLRGGQILLPRDVKDIMRSDILLPH